MGASSRLEQGSTGKGECTRIPVLLGSLGTTWGYQETCCYL